MKAILLLLSLFLFAFATVSFPRAVDARDSLPQPALVDIFGNKVIAGNGYYIYTALDKKPIMGATPGIASNVVLSEAKFAFPVIMSSASNDEYVRLGTDLNIKFDYGIHHDVSTIWKVDFNPWVRGDSVMMGGNESDKFQFVKHGADENVYALFRCFLPSRVACQKIGGAPYGSLFTFLKPGMEPVPFVFSPVKVPLISSE